MSDKEKGNLMPGTETPTHKLEISAGAGLYIKADPTFWIRCNGDRQEEPCPKCGRDELRVAAGAVIMQGTNYRIERQCHACGESDFIPFAEQRAHSEIRIPRERLELERLAELLLSYPDLAERIRGLLESAK